MVIFILEGILSTNFAEGNYVSIDHKDIDHKQTVTPSEYIIISLITLTSQWAR